MKMLKILLEKYKKEYAINLEEGLTKTTNLGKTVNILKRNFPELEIDSYNEDNIFIVKGLTQDTINTLLKYTNNLGWFPSWINSPFYIGKYSEEQDINSTSIIRFEAKYDEKIDKIPNILYHITPAQNTEKILAKGLSPRSRRKATYHPERVYILKDRSQAEDLTDKFYQKTGETIWDLLKIDTTKIPGDYLKLYKDPNYVYGFYTLNNIPPQAIQVEEKIFI